MRSFHKVSRNSLHRLFSTAIPFKGIHPCTYTSTPNFISSFPGIPIYQCLDPNGTVKDPSTPIPPPETLLSMLENMIALSIYDKVLYGIQRQGRISFYMTATGEEAGTVAAGAALGENDVILSQYRELGVLLARGFTLDEVLYQLFGTSLDPGKGRQMPIHYTSKRINLQTISSPLATQIIQASGCGYALAQEARGCVPSRSPERDTTSPLETHAPLGETQKNGGATWNHKTEFSRSLGETQQTGGETWNSSSSETQSPKGDTNSDRIAVTFFGEGAASEGDFSPALNFASVLNCRTLFICRNNGYAISTNVNEQYRGDGISIRGVSYNIHTLRVDGNDALAVYHSVKMAREYIIENNRPVLLELMTYRLSHHSTSDDSSKYREDKELELWSSEGMHGMTRLKRYLEKEGLWTEEREREVSERERSRVMAGIKKVESELKHASIDELFTDVYDELPGSLKEQKKEFSEHYKKYRRRYDALDRYLTSETFPTA